MISSSTKQGTEGKRGLGEPIGSSSQGRSTKPIQARDAGLMLSSSFNVCLLEEEKVKPSKGASANRSLLFRLGQLR